MQHTLYDLATGRIKAVYQSPDFEGFAPNIGPGDGWHEGSIDPALYYIVAGAPMPFPDRPGEWAVWDWECHAWTDPRDADWLAERAEAALAALRAERDARIAAVQWRLQRWRDERELGLTTTDDGAALLAYVQALRDLPETTIDPAAPVWPALPES